MVASSKNPHYGRLLLLSATGLMVLLYPFLAFPSDLKPVVLKLPPVNTKAVIAAPAHSLVSVDPDMDSLSMNVSSDCPIPKLGLIGVSVTTEPSSTLRRNLLRETYQKINKNLKFDNQFDFIYVFGNAKTWEQDLDLALEEMIFPDDTFVTTREENMNNGKTLDWFLYARSIMYTEHPDREGEYCLRYRFIGKTDDDTVIHLPRLAGVLNTLDPNESHYVGRVINDGTGIYMTGMLYLLSADVVEWIHHSPIPRSHGYGHEDKQVGTWFYEGGITGHVKLQHQGHRFHDLEESPNVNIWRSGPNSVVIHWCKDVPRMFRCLTDLYGSPEVAVRRLTSAHSVKLYRKRVETVFPEVKSQKGLQNVSVVPSYNIDTQISGALIRPVLESMMPKLIRDPIVEEDWPNILEHLAVRIPNLKVEGVEWGIWRALASKELPVAFNTWENKIANLSVAIVKQRNGTGLSLAEFNQLRMLHLDNHFKFKTNITLH